MRPPYDDYKANLLERLRHAEYALEYLKACKEEGFTVFIGAIEDVMEAQVNLEAFPQLQSFVAILERFKASQEEAIA